ncbi:MAG TPA: energy-coupling factor transporter transmembrane component T [Patescibacteria group bacterium]|nr:energy-coupling factor transporter transmembrane component T [Patescibacteria group bacterium]
MIRPSTIGDVRATSPLGRASPLAKLGIAMIWLIGLAFTVRPGPPLAIAVVAFGAGVVLGRIRPLALVRALAPLWLVAGVVIVSNVLFGAANPDPASTELGRFGPLRVTAEAVATAAGLGLRVVAIAVVGAVFALTTEPTTFVDALVQQGRVPERFAYGALAAYQAIPRFADDLVALRQARRIRGLRGGWHPRLLVGLLVLAIRHGDRVALSMDARGFGSGPRSRFRVVRWRAVDGLLVAAAVAALGAAIRLSP